MISNRIRIIIRRALRSCSAFAFYAAAFFLASCNERDTLFSRLESTDTGIDFVNENHETEKSNILSYEYFYNGGGVALGDINNDGLIDIYFTSNLFSNKLYLNKGNFEFEDITQKSGTACEVGWKTGVTMVDINNDGLLDIYVCRSGSPEKDRRRNLLLINNGNLTFTDKAKEYGLDDTSYSTQAAFFDYDHDNDLDVLLLNHSLLAISNVYKLNVKNSNTRFPEVGNKLLRNDNGHFTDISDTTGVYGSAFNYGLGISISDINNDGWPDVYVGCDYTGRDKLLFNDSGKFFNDVTDQLSHISKFTMGTDIADVNNDGLMDIYTVDMLPEDNYRQKQLQGSDRYDEYYAMVRSGLHHQNMRNMLHLNNGNGTFSEVGQMMRVANTDWSWAALFSDFDNDGVQDLFVSNGFKRDLTNNDFAKFQAFNQINEVRQKGETLTSLDAIAKFTENKIPNYVFRGSIDSAFQNVTEAWGLNEPTLSNGAVYADLDNDGDLDLVTNNINEKAGVYRNNSERINQNSFLRVKLKMQGKNAFAIGSKVIVYGGNKMFVRELFPVRGFQSSVEPILHFGLGKLQMIDSIKIQWPDGTVQTSGATSVNQVLSINSEANRFLAAKKEKIRTLFERDPTNASFTHTENDFIDFRTQALLPRMYSREGPAVARGDVNDDGVTDYYFGGAAGHAAQILIGGKNGAFLKSNEALLEKDKSSEDVDALFVDVDADKDLDLYVVTGGYETMKPELLIDKLYINNGKGIFTSHSLPQIAGNGACVKTADIDLDGRPDLFVGGSVVPGSYPLAHESVILHNEGNGEFSLYKNVPESITHSGIVSDAVWTELNGDRFPDLIVVGEWMPVKVFINEQGVLTDRSKEFISDKTEGLWTAIAKHDFDNDGDDDFVLGNYGLNSQMQASSNEPVTLVFDDFDKNGSVDPIVNYFIQHKSCPYPSRDELTEQLPSFKKRFTDYKSYSVADIQTVLTKEEFDKAKKLNAYVLETSYLRNDKGKLKLMPMPKELQRSPLFAIAVMDVNHDGNADIITGGNISSGRARTGKMTGNYGLVCLSDGKGNFKSVAPPESGIGVIGDVRNILVDGEKVFFVINGGPSEWYRIRKRDGAR